MTLSVAIIGGGAAGLMCAATLIEESRDIDVHLFEKNIRLGSKVIISGGGRCNVTTGIRDKKELFSKYIRGSKFLKTAIGQFPPEKVEQWFEDHGVPLKTEKDGRVFPVSDDGKDVVGVFDILFKDLNLHLKESVVEVKPKTDVSCRIVSDKATYEFDVVVLCTGGNAYRHTGSTGDGYDFAKSFGHSITKLGPSLNSFLCTEDWVHGISGLSLPDAKLVAVTGETVSGPMLFTHFGVSGPAVFALSSHLAFHEVSDVQPVKVSIIPIADMTDQRWNDHLRSSMELNGAQHILTLLKEHIPSRLAQIVIDQAGLFAEKKNSEISKVDRSNLAKILGNGLEVTFVKRRAGDEFVTAGGIDLSEVSAKTMQSRLHKSLYFAGELLDVDGVTGGFNLQASWATGRLAAKSIVSGF